MNFVALLRRRPWAANLLLFLAAAGFTLLAAELWLRFGYLRSDAFGTTVASRQWRKRYWRPINAAGYRDREWDLTPGRRRIVLLGDSFLAGAGLEDLEATLAGQLRPRRPEARFFVIAKPGWNTVEERRALQELPFRPDLVLCGYYMNDIGGSVAAMPPVSSGIWLVEKSALLNFVYWGFHRRDSVWSAYAEGMLAAYQDPSRWAAHRAELDGLVADCRARGIPLRFVFYPILTAPGHPAHTVMREYFQASGLPWFEVSTVINEAALSVEQCLVSRLDPHPSARLNELIGATLAPQLDRPVVDGPERPGL